MAYPTQEPGPRCSGCGVTLRRDNICGVCQPCRRLGKAWHRDPFSPAHEARIVRYTEMAALHLPLKDEEAHYVPD